MLYERGQKRAGLKKKNERKETTKGMKAAVVLLESEKEFSS